MRGCAKSGKSCKCHTYYARDVHRSLQKGCGIRVHGSAPLPCMAWCICAELCRECARPWLSRHGPRRDIVRMIAHSESGILLTSYDQLRLQRNLLLGVSWGYAILDEGHKIRNPDAEARPAGQL